MALKPWKVDTMIAVVAATPYYVLRDEAGRVGPKILNVPGIQSSAIYGFSDKGPYDKFCGNSPAWLAPYPLVKGYLRSQIEAADERLHLVVVDATGPSQPLLHATTMEVLLESQEKRTDHVAVTHHLTFDQQTEAYRVEAVAS